MPYKFTSFLRHSPELEPAFVFFCRTVSATQGNHWQSLRRSDSWKMLEDDDLVSRKMSTKYPMISFIFLQSWHPHVCTCLSIHRVWPTSHSPLNFLLCKAETTHNHQCPGIESNEVGHIHPTLSPRSRSSNMSRLPPSLECFLRSPFFWGGSLIETSTDLWVIMNVYNYII